MCWAPSQAFTSAFASLQQPGLLCFVMKSSSGVSITKGQLRDDTALEPEEPPCGVLPPSLQCIEGGGMKGPERGGDCLRAPSKSVVQPLWLGSYVLSEAFLLPQRSVHIV